MAKPWYVPNEAELAGAHKPFLYELVMFRWTIDRRIDLDDNRKNSLLRRPLLESALVHARILLNFFDRDGSADDEILAAHFVKQADRQVWNPSALKHLRARRSDINKALSHLTYTRVTSKPEWTTEELKGLRQEVEAAYLEFLDALPLAERARWQI